MNWRPTASSVAARYKPRPKHPVKLHVWAGISWRGLTRVCIFEGTMNANLYVAILEDYLLPFILTEYPSYHQFIQDSDPKHTSRCAHDFFEQRNINWWRTPSPESPNADPKENLRHELKVRSLYSLKPAPRDQGSYPSTFVVIMAKTSLCIFIL